MLSSGVIPNHFTSWPRAIRLAPTLKVGLICPKNGGTTNKNLDGCSGFEAFAIACSNKSAAVAEGAILEESIKELEVKCLPSDLVDAFDVDLAVLANMGDSIRVSDLNLGDKYTVLTNADDVVVAAAKPAKVEVIEDAAPEAPAMEDEEEKA